MDGVGGCGCRLVWGRRGKAQVRELGRGQGNFKLAANFGYNSRGSADPRESLRKRRILKLALTAHTVLPTPGARLLLLSTDISTTPACLIFLYPIATLLLPICSPHNPFSPVANTQKVHAYAIRTDSLLLAPLAEMRSSP